MEYLVLLGLVVFIFFMLRFIVSSDREEKGKKLKKANDEAQKKAEARGLLVSCPLCSSPLAKGEDVMGPAQELAEQLAGMGLEVAIDDRDERAGVKFADADLIGWPLQVVVGKRGLADGKVELKLRKTGAKRDAERASFVEVIAPAAEDLLAGAIDPFDRLFEL